MTEAKRRAQIEALQKRSSHIEGDFIDEYSYIGGSSLNLKLMKSNRESGASTYDGYNDDGLERTNAISRRNKGTNKDYRLPQVAFAVKLESVLMDLWKRKIAWDFIFPVNGAAVKGYYELITNPICLSEIRERIARLQYTTVRSFLEDLHLMVSNAILFNGKESTVTKNAETLYKHAESSLEHERKLLGAHKDTFAILEEAIVDKLAYLGRPIPSKKTPTESFSAAVMTAPSVSHAIAVTSPIIVSTAVSAQNVEEGELPDADDESSSGEEEEIANSSGFKGGVT
jgi:hypothetical protein